MRLTLAISALAACILLGGVCAYSAPPFDDVPPDDPHAEAVEALREMGVIMGFPDGSYRGDEAVTRYELAAVVRRMMQYYERSLPGKEEKAVNAEDQHRSEQTSPDAGSSKSPGSQDMAWLQSRNVQLPATMLNSPDNAATVDEVAGVLASAFARLIEAASPGYEQEQQHSATSDSGAGAASPSSPQ